MSNIPVMLAVSMSAALGNNICSKIYSKKSLGKTIMAFRLGADLAIVGEKK